MPRGNGTGPWGTFRNCTPAGAQGSMRYAPFYGKRFFGRGGFGGRGFRWRFLATGIPGWQWQQSRQAPITQQTRESEIKSLEQELEAIKRRLQELKGD